MDFSLTVRALLKIESQEDESYKLIVQLISQAETPNSCSVEIPADFETEAAARQFGATQAARAFAEKRARAHFPAGTRINYEDWGPTPLN